ncbi:hypothetical protein [Acinetobacter sp. HR7]|uniref:hypothetical protein n=1 Tax=Acinetobacter sp. HR7 TaxID=1509403 RepID=UPI00053858F6|nr:hypothetical protein [Acinetobacter sp. HR7]KGT48782.1 hypothetical protein GW12_01690 [Acinetobacter sp. HR7]
MKKLISGLMVGLITATATMSAMAAPSHKHHVPPHAAHFDHKPMPHKGGFHKAPPKPHFNKHDVHHKFDKKDHKGFFNKHHHNGPMHKMPPKHR